MNKSKTSSEDLGDLRSEMEKKEAFLGAMKAAFFNRTPLEGKVPVYEDLVGAAKEYIKVNYKFQKARFGKVRLKMSPTDLLR